MEDRSDRTMTATWLPSLARTRSKTISGIWAEMTATSLAHHLSLESTPQIQLSMDDIPPVVCYAVLRARH